MRVLVTGGAGFIGSHLVDALLAVRFGNGQRGWVGDSPLVKLDTAHIKLCGWKPTVTIEEGIRRTVRYLKANPELLARA